MEKILAKVFFIFVVFITFWILNAFLACVYASLPIQAIRIVSWSEWDAKPPTGVQYINHKVPYVIIHHTYIPSACYTERECISAMQSIQKYHQVDNQWADIGYT